MKINGASYAIKMHQDDGSLPCLFMLHGFMGDGRVFHHLTDDLREVCNPVTIDLLGHGKSEKVHDPDRYGEKQQIADIIQIVEQISAGSGISDSTNADHGTNVNDNDNLNRGLSAGAGAKARANSISSFATDPNTTPTHHLPFLYGYSMGGRLALKTALQAPELFGGLILESTNPGIADPEKRADRRKADARRSRLIKQDYTAFLGEWEQLPLFKSPLKTDKKLENRYKEIHLAQGPEAMAASLLGFGTGSMKPVIRNATTKFKNPAIVVAGTEDQKYMKINRKLSTCFSRARLCTIPAGHRVHLDNPSQLSRELIRTISVNM